jgi:hypothetical protein
MISSARRVPPRVELVAAGQEDPGRPAQGPDGGFLIGLLAGHRMDRPDGRDAQLTEHAPVSLAGLEAE